MEDTTAAGDAPEIPDVDKDDMTLRKRQEARKKFKKAVKNLCHKQNASFGQWLPQLVERSLPISKVRGSNPVIGKNIY